jgi:hypothetical protein
MLAVQLIEGAPVVGVGRGAVPDWMRLGSLDTFLHWVAGEARVCMHAPDPRRPEPVFAAAWKPGLVTCGRCAFLLKAVGDDDRRCDCCGHLCAGVDAGDPICTTTVWLGALAYQAGVCGDCHTDFADPPGVTA